VCLSVCVSVTLSVNAPTGQTPLRIFTVDSLADADLRKDVPFGGLDDEYLHLGVQSPQNPHFGGLNRHFKPKYAKNSNSYIFRSVYQIDMKFDRQLRPATETSWVVSYDGKTIQRWRTAAILKVVISPYLSEKSSDFDEMLYTAADFELDERHVIKNEKLHWTDSEFDERISCCFNIHGDSCLSCPFQAPNFLCTVIVP